MADGKIKLFVSVQRFYESMGIRSLHSKTSSKGKNVQIYNGKNLFLIISLGQSILSCAAFILIEAQSVDQYGIAFYVVVTLSNQLHAVFRSIDKIASIAKLIGKCEQFIEKRLDECPNAFTFYNNLARNIDWACEMLYFLIVKITFAASMLPPLLVTTVNYFIFDLKNESYFLISPVVLPFNWRTPFGYLVAVIGQFAATYSAIISATTYMAFFISSCAILIGILREFTNDLQALDCIKISTENERLFGQRFVRIIRICSDAKQLADEFNAINRYILTGYFLWTIAAISSTLLVFQLQLSEHTTNPIILITECFLVFWAFMVLLIFCALGEMVIIQFNEFNEQICESNWYLFPIEVQRMFVIFMAITQQPTVIRGFANCVCTREAFKQTVNGGFSYFMTLRQFG